MIVHGDHIEAEFGPPSYIALADKFQRKLEEKLISTYGPVVRELLKKARNSCLQEPSITFVDISKELDYKFRRWLSHNNAVLLGLYEFWNLISNLKELNSEEKVRPTPIQSNTRDIKSPQYNDTERAFTFPPAIDRTVYFDYRQAPFSGQKTHRRGLTLSQPSLIFHLA